MLLDVLFAVGGSIVSAIWVLISWSTVQWYKALSLGNVWTVDLLLWLLRKWAKRRCFSVTSHWANQFPSNVVDLDIGCHNDLLQVEEFATDMVCESQCVNLDMGEDICSDIPWLPKIETVYFEAIVKEDDYLNVKSNIDDSPLFSTPWLPIITSVYSEAVDHVNNGIKSTADFDSTHQIPCFPKIESVCSGDTTYENNLPSLDFDPAYRTDLPIENCPKCYTNLTPVQFTVNVVTAVMKTSCQCGLSIEIIPKLSTFKGATIQRKRKRSESTIALKRLRLA